MKTKKYQQSDKWKLKEKMKRAVAQYILRQLDPAHTQSEVAAKFGCARQAVAQMEIKLLWRVWLAALIQTGHTDEEIAEMTADIVVKMQTDPVKRRFHLAADSIRLRPVKN